MTGGDLLTWAVFGFWTVTGCGALAPQPDDLDKLDSVQKVAMLVCAEHEGKTRGMPAEQAFVEFCSAEEQIRPWVERLTAPGATCKDDGGTGGAGGGAP